MGGYKHHEPTVYVVRWPDGVLKVGYTAARRWRKFEIRGALVAELFAASGVMSAFDLEQAGHIWLSDRFEAAFTKSQEAESHLGTGGGGWMECYRDVPEEAVAVLLGHMRMHMRSHDADALPPLDARTDGTDALTKNLDADSDITHLSNAREPDPESITCPTCTEPVDRLPHPPCQDDDQPETEPY